LLLIWAVKLPKSTTKYLSLKFSITLF